MKLNSMSGTVRNAEKYSLKNRNALRKDQFSKVQIAKKSLQLNCLLTLSFMKLRTVDLQTCMSLTRICILVYNIYIYIYIVSVLWSEVT